MKVLKKGSKGTEVRKWQKFLIEQCFKLGAVDGDFGPKTHKATVAFQKEHGLEPDGMVGKNTFSKAAELGYDYKPSKTGTTYTNELKQEYKELYDSCEIKSNRESDVDAIVNKILRNADRYKDVSVPLGIPWQFIAVIHNMESSLNFNTHLHNGDSLQRRTVHVPAGRPRAGSPPFTWEESAADAMKYKKLHLWEDWSIPGILYNLEKYNGWGYRKHHSHVLSPYLWSFTNHYTSGKYVADGKWSDTAVSKQCGAAALLKKLYEEEIVTPEVIKVDTKYITPEEVPYNWIRKELVLDKTYKKGDKGKQVKIIQEWLDFHGLGLMLDGDFGPITEKVVIEFQKKKKLDADGIVDTNTFNELIKPALRALTPIKPGNKSYSKLVVEYAKQHLKEHPVEVGGNNRGPWVRMYMKGQQGGVYPWCAGFATFILKQASDNSDYDMPVGTTFSCDVLANEGKANGLFVAGKKIINGSVDYNEMPKGSIFLVRKTSSDWTHTGIAIDFDANGVETIEGNTNDEGSREGYEVCLRFRAYRKLDFVKVE